MIRLVRGGAKSPSARLGAIVVAGAAVAALLSGCLASGEGAGSRSRKPESSNQPGRVGRTPVSGVVGWGPTAAEVASARRAVGAMTDRELVGQVFVVGYGGQTPPLALVRKYHLGGVIVDESNIGSVAAVTASNALLQTADDRPWPLVVSVDQEGGTVTRVPPPMTQFPTYMSLGADRDPALARRAGFASGQALRAAGFTLDFAPDADVTIGPADPEIGSRSAGSHARAVARTVVTSVRGLREAGMPAVVKHFPGHGSVTVDSHVALPHQEASVKALRNRDFIPFQQATEAHVPGVMVGHIALDRVDPDVPASMSKPDVALLTHGLGFNGVVATDALSMGAVTDSYSPGEAALAALRAGADLLLLPPNLPVAYRTVVRALRDGTLPRSILETAATKIGALMLHEAKVPVPPLSAITAHRRLSEQISADAISVVEGACQGPYVGDAVRAVGDPVLVSRFDAVARRAGLSTGTGPVLGFFGGDPLRRRVDIAVSIATPYDLADARGAPVRLALFGWTPEAMQALVSVLTGDAQPRGTLPVSIPGMSPPHCG